MKTSAIWMFSLWLGLVCEQSKPGLFPSGSLIFPLTVGCLFWLRNGVGSLLAGTALIVHWLLHPTIAPFEIMVILLLATVFIAGARISDTWSPATTRQQQHAWWLHPLIVMFAGMASHMLSSGMTMSTGFSELTNRLIIALPCLALLIFLARAADEFGFRRNSAM